jgi:hypothetical protein
MDLVLVISASVWCIVILRWIYMQFDSTPPSNNHEDEEEEEYIDWKD